MIRDFIKRNQFPLSQPRWFRILNGCILLPVVAWPLVFFGSIFIADNPNRDENTMLLLFILINLYPLYLLVIAYLNSLIFRVSRIAATAVALAFVGAMICVTGWFLA